LETFPTVSIIVPCLNEERRVLFLLEAILIQTYPLGKLEVVIADGMSTDRTREVIAAFVERHPEIKISVVDNTLVNIPSALNRAITASSGEVILRLDAHSYPKADYIERCVNGLVDGKGDNIGGIWIIESDNDSWISKSIAFAASNPLGVGDAKYRHAKTALEVETVPFGCFYRKTIEKVGLYDENILTNEDYELNTRIRKAGGRIWLDPAIQSIYFARGSLTLLAKQYFRYGFWKYKMLKQHPETIIWRQALPPLFVLSILLLVGLGFINPLFHWILLIELAMYLIPQFVVSGSAALQNQAWYLFFGVPAAISTMHMAWGSGFLASLLPGKEN